MTNRELVAAAWEEARHTTILLSTWEKKTMTAAQAAASRWGKSRALLNQVTNDQGGGAAWHPAGQIRLEVPIIDRYRRDQATRSLTPEFFMIVDWVEHPYRFEIDGAPIGTFTSKAGGSDGSAVYGKAPTPLSVGLHVLQGFEDTHGTVSVPVTFLVDPVNGPPA